MVDQLEYEIDFTGYYDNCAPVQCTYTHTQRSTFIYVITVLISFYGGLSVALRIVAPFIVQVGHYIYEKFQKKSKPVIGQQQPKFRMF